MRQNCGNRCKRAIIIIYKIAIAIYNKCNIIINRKVDLFMKKIKFYYTCGTQKFTAIFDEHRLYNLLTGLKVDLITYISNNPFITKVEVVDNAN